MPLPWEKYAAQAESGVDSAPAGAPTAVLPWERYGGSTPVAKGVPTPEDLKRESDATIDNRSMLLPFSPTRGGDVVLAPPKAITAVQDVVRSIPGAIAGQVNDIGNATKRILTGEAREPKDMSPQEMLALGSYSPTRPVLGMGGALKPILPGSAVSDVARAGRSLGITIPKVASDPTRLNTVGAKVVGAVPWAGDPLRNAAALASAKLTDAATTTKDVLGSSSLYQAGKAIETGLTDFAGPGGALSRNAKAAYDEVDLLVPPHSTGPLTATASLVQEMTNKATAAGLKPGTVVDTITEAATRPGGLTYEGVKTLRTKIGEWMDDKPLAAAANVSQKDAAVAYKALTEDLRSIVEAGGGKPALDAWEQANALAARHAEIRTSLAKILNTGNEGEGALFSRLIGMAGSKARADVDTLALAREAVGDAKWGDVLSAAVEKMGFDEKGNFAPEMFAKQWNTLTPEAKAVLFRTADEKRHLAALDSIAKISEVSKTLETIGAPPPRFIGGVFGLSAAAATVTALKPDSWPFVAGTVLGSRVIANALAKPESASAFANWAWASHAFAGRPSAHTAAALGEAARALAYFVAQNEALDKKSQLYLGNYLQGGTPGQPLAKPPALPAEPAAPLPPGPRA